jgi:hypothetical protein
MLVPEGLACSMLEQISEEIAECYRRAEKAAEQARQAADETLRQTYLDLERRWILLAHSYELQHRIGDFTAELKRQVAVLKPPHPSMLRVTCPRCGKPMRLERIDPAPEPRRADEMNFRCVCSYTLQLTVDR